jgi:hypothetical protein
LTLLHGLTYEEYLKTTWWRARREAVLRYRGERCEQCGGDWRLQLHHRTYERLGRERPEDVELLCRYCHLEEHRLWEELFEELDAFEAPLWLRRQVAQRWAKDITF